MNWIVRYELEDGYESQHVQKSLISSVSKAFDLFADYSGELERLSIEWERGSE